MKTGFAEEIERVIDAAEDAPDELEGVVQDLEIRMTALFKEFSDRVGSAKDYRARRLKDALRNAGTDR